MARIASTVLVVALLAATAAAFALTEGLKLQPSPITGPIDVSKIFSPVCRCDTATANVGFRLREGDVLDVEIVDLDGSVVATVARGARRRAGPVDFTWDGRDDAGRVVPEGEYLPRVHLREERETITLPNAIRIDVTPPVVLALDVEPKVFSPDGDGRSDRVRATYRLSEEARGILFVNGVRRGLKKFARTEGDLVWNGKLAGTSLSPGRYRVAVGASDPAGNLAKRTPPEVVVIRYVALGRDRVEALAGTRFAIRVSSDARTVRWRLGARSGTAAPGTLRLLAPAQKGRYTLTVTANGRSARAAVIVRERP